MNSITLTDTTMRDGSHSVRHQFTETEAALLARAMDEAGIDIIEIGHGDGLTGSSCNYGFSAFSDAQLVRAAARVVRRARIAVLLLPGIGTAEDLREIQDAGASVVRVATHVTEADISAQHIAEARKMGLFVVGFLMMAHRAPADRVLEEAKKMESYGANVVYVTDSAGALLPDGVRERVSLMRENLSVPVGFHSHDNLGLAIGNSLAAIESGASYIDGSLGGLGAGAGNTPTETLVAVLNRAGIPVMADLFKTIDASTKVLGPILQRHGAGIAPLEDPLLLGYTGVYSSFMLHSKRAAARFGVDYRDIILELGRLEAVGGQEDWIYEIAECMSKENYV